MKGFFFLADAVLALVLFAGIFFMGGSQPAETGYRERAFKQISCDYCDSLAGEMEGELREARTGSAEAEENLEKALLDAAETEGGYVKLFVGGKLIAERECERRVFLSEAKCARILFDGNDFYEVEVIYRK